MQLLKQRFWNRKYQTSTSFLRSLYVFSPLETLPKLKYKPTNRAQPVELYSLSILISFWVTEQNYYNVCVFSKTWW